MAALCYLLSPPGLVMTPFAPFALHQRGKQTAISTPMTQTPIKIKKQKKNSAMLRVLRDDDPLMFHTHLAMVNRARNAGDWTIVCAMSLSAVVLLVSVTMVATLHIGTVGPHRWQEQDCVPTLKDLLENNRSILVLRVHWGNVTTTSGGQEMFEVVEWPFLFLEEHFLFARESLFLSMNGRLRKMLNVSVLHADIDLQKSRCFGAAGSWMYMGHGTALLNMFRGTFESGGFADSDGSLTELDGFLPSKEAWFDTLPTKMIYYVVARILATALVSAVSICLIESQQVMQQLRMSRFPLHSAQAIHQLFSVGALLLALTLLAGEFLQERILAVCCVCLIWMSCLFMRVNVRCQISMGLFPGLLRECLIAMVVYRMHFGNFGYSYEFLLMIGAILQLCACWLFLQECKAVARGEISHQCPRFGLRVIQVNVLHQAGAPIPPPPPPPPPPPQPIPPIIPGDLNNYNHGVHQ